MVYEESIISHPSVEMYIPVACYLWWFHIEHFCNPALHDQEVRVVDIELDGAKEVLYSRRRCIAAIDQILVTSSNYNLERHTKLMKEQGHLSKPNTNWPLSFVYVPQIIPLILESFHFVKCKQDATTYCMHVRETSTPLRRRYNRKHNVMTSHA